MGADHTNIVFTVLLSLSIIYYLLPITYFLAITYYLLPIKVHNG